MRFFIILLSAVCFSGYAQTTYKEKLTLLPHEEKIYEVPGADGDAIQMEFERDGGSKINLEVTIYPQRPFFHENDFKNLKRIITVTTPGVYVVKLINTTDKQAVYSVNIVSQNYTGLPVTLDHKTVRDTTYGYRTKQLKTVEKLETVTLQNEKFYVNSRSNAFIKGGKSRVLVPVNLPENTVEWYYVFTASRNEDEVKQTLNTFNLASVLSGYIKRDADLKSAVANMVTPPGAEICDIYLLDEKNAWQFTDKEDFSYNLNASRENYKSGLVRVWDTNANKVYLGLSNPDNLHGIHIAVEVVAVVKRTETVEVMVSIPVITSKIIPVVKDL